MNKDADSDVPIRKHEHAEGEGLIAEPHPSDSLIALLSLMPLALALCFSILLAASIIMPSQIAYAESLPADSNEYQLYDTKQKNQQVIINKVWNDGLDNAQRKLSDKTTGDTDYHNALAISIMTGVPQATLRTYAIVFDANGGTFGTDSDGKQIENNAVTYNAKNQPTTGTYETPSKTDVVCVGWSTDKIATEPDEAITNAVKNPDPHNAWMNSIKDKTTITVYPVWKDLKFKYAVMLYNQYRIINNPDYFKNPANGYGANDRVFLTTFGPAIGYPEFSDYKEQKPDTTAIPSMTRHHTTSDTEPMDESEPACTDDSHSIITDSDDVGTDHNDNKYRQ